MLSLLSFRSLLIESIPHSYGLENSNDKPDLLNFIRSNVKILYAMKSKTATALNHIKTAAIN